MQKFASPFRTTTWCTFKASLSLALCISIRPRVSKLQAAGQIRPVKPFHPAREATEAYSSWGLQTKRQYTYEKFVDLVECNLFENNDIMHDVRPSNCCVIAYVVL